MALHCAELLNKWAAASPEYSKDLVMRAAEYSVRSQAPRPARSTGRCGYARSVGSYGSNRIPGEGRFTSVAAE